MMDKNTLLAVVLSFGILAIWSWLFPPAKIPEQTQHPMNGEETTIELSQQEESGVIDSSAIMATDSEKENFPIAPTQEAIQAKEIVIETDQYRAVINTQGGLLTSFLLKNYNHTKSRITLDQWLPFLSFLFSSPVPPPTEDNLVQMVQNRIAKVQTLDVQFDNLPELTNLLQQAVYLTNVESLDLRGATESQKLVLTSPTVLGIQVVKTVEFLPNEYVFNYKVQVINHSQETRNLVTRYVFGEGRIVDSVNNQLGAGGHVGPVYYYDSVETEDADDLESEIKLPLRLEDETLLWAGMEDLYFIKATAPLKPVDAAFFHAAPYFKGTERNLEPFYGFKLPRVGLQAGKRFESEFEMFYGPKDEKIMASFGRQLILSQQMTLESIAVPLMQLLRWIQSYFPNYGVAIIILTIIVRLVLFPLTYRGMKSMKRMQKLQPKMMKLKERHKNNKQKLNQEMIALYQKHKINPVSGCLPLLLQIPIFIALYSALMSAVELRHTEFIWWINDLSAPDGLGITPILMGLSMYVQQKMSANPMMDPMQQKIMNMLPLIFTVFTFTFPSGLTIYWVTSNVLSIGQQYFINKIKTPELEE